MKLTIIFSQLSWSWVLLSLASLTLEHFQPLKKLLIKKSHRLSFALLILALANMPLGLIHYLKGLTFAPSAGLILLCFWPLARCWHQHRPSLFNKNKAPPRNTLLPQTILGLSLFLYPFALGLGLWDPYRYGFLSQGHMLFALVCCLVSAIALRAGQPWQELALWGALGLLFFTLGFFESQNLWDALIDPIAMFWALFYLIQIPKQRKLTGDTKAIFCDQRLNQSQKKSSVA